MLHREHGRHVRADRHGYGFHAGALGAKLDRRVASPATATTDFLAPDILNKCGRAVPAVPSALCSTLATMGVPCLDPARRPDVEPISVPVPTLGFRHQCLARLDHLFDPLGQCVTGSLLRLRVRPLVLVDLHCRRHRAAASVEVRWLAT